MLKVSNLKVKQGLFKLEIPELSISNSGIILLLGPNGSGKTTFFKSISGFLNYDGSVLFNNTEVKTMSFKERARHIAYLPQFIYLNSIMVRDFLIMGRFPHTGMMSAYTSQDWQKVDEAVKMFNLKDYICRDISTLSQGELQRVYLAKVFIQDAKVLLLDEPTSVLDIGQKQRTAELIQSYIELKKDSIAIIATHEPGIFISSTDNIIMLKQGLIYTYNSKKEIYTKDKIAELFSIN